MQRLLMLVLAIHLVACSSDSGEGDIVEPTNNGSTGRDMGANNSVDEPDDGDPDAGDQGCIVCPNEHTRIFAGYSQFCALPLGGDLVCWGNTVLDSAAIHEDHPIGQDFVEIAIGREHACGLHPDGSVTCWGNDSRGETDAPDDRFKQIAAGFRASCGITFDSQLKCWGETLDPPAPTTGTFRHVDIDSVGCAIRSDGMAVCFDSPGGEAYLVDGVYRAIEARVADYDTLDIGGSYACGIVDGNIYCWGRSVDYDIDSHPTTGGWKDLSMNSVHGCALSEQGTIECWGSEFSVPTIPESENADIIEITTPRDGVCAVKSDNSVHCWGPWADDVPDGL